MPYAARDYDILGLGECLIDMLCLPENEDGPAVQTHPGGAPANMLGMASALGLRTALISRVGEDAFGHFLLSALQDAGIGTEFVSLDPRHPTTLAMVSLDEKGDRSFSFCRDHTADVSLEPADLPQEAFARSRIFHTGSLSLTCEPVYSAALRGLELAREAGCLISYDPNWRPALWTDHELGLRRMREPLMDADLVKASREELELLTGCSEIEEGAAALLADYPCSLLAVTDGARGASLYTRRLRLRASALAVTVCDTTGAGDAFWGAALAFWLKQELRAETLTQEQAEALLRTAVMAGSLTTTRPGGLSALPDERVLEERLRQDATITVSFR